MSERTDQDILDIFFRSICEKRLGSYYDTNPDELKNCQPDDEVNGQFTPKDLVGKTIESYREIKNPRKYDPKVTVANPTYFGVWEFSDGTMLLNEHWGDGECTHLHSFYYNNKEVLFTDVFNRIDSYRMFFTNKEKE